MDKDMIAATLRDAGFQVQSSARMGDGDGWRITLANGAVVHCFDDGRCIVHGSGAARLRSLLRANRGRARPATGAPWIVARGRANSPSPVDASQSPTSAGAGTGGATSHQPDAETKRQIWRPLWRSP